MFIRLSIPMNVLFPTRVTIKNFTCASSDIVRKGGRSIVACVRIGDDPLQHRRNKNNDNHSENALRRI